MKMIKQLLIILYITLISGCSAMQSEPSKISVIERDGISALFNTSDIKMTFIKGPLTKDRFCAARETDVADTSSAGVSLGASLGIGGVEGVSEGRTQGALSLGGRDPAVLIVREMMYRACELSINHNADITQSMEIYTHFMNATKDLISNQTGAGQAALGQQATAVTTTTISENLGNTSGESTSTDDDEDDDDE